MLPGAAFAAWGDELWGIMIWGESLPVPTLPGFGLIALATALSAIAAWRLRHRRRALGLPVLLVLLAVPLVVVAGTVAVPNTFVNGEVADADQVNANFDAVETAVNDNDARIGGAQSTADSALVSAAAAEVAASTAQTGLSDLEGEVAALQAGGGSLPAGLQIFLASFCGNSTIEPGIETCDDGNTTDDANGCSATCLLNGECGDGIVQPLTGESCDDGNTEDDGDGCSATCVMNGVCGDGNLQPLSGETCDAGGNAEVDGCSESCQIESGWVCSTVAPTPSVCAEDCGDGAMVGTETCDDQNLEDGDGCSSTCSVEYDYDCSGTPSVCVQARFAECPDGKTILDREMGLLWERKTGSLGPWVVCETAPGGCPDPHDVNNRYEWSNTGEAADGNAYTDFLASLNTAPGFVGHTDWRLPTISELQSIVDPRFSALGGPIALAFHWTASIAAESPSAVFSVDFETGGVGFEYDLTNVLFVRAVRTGSCTE